MGEGLEGKDGGEVQVKTPEGIAEENEELEGEDSNEEELAEALEDIAEEVQDLEGEEGDEEELVEALEEIEEEIEELDAVTPSVAALASIVVEPTGITKVYKGALLGCAVVAMAAYALLMYKIKGSKKHKLDI